LTRNGWRDQHLERPALRGYSRRPGRRKHSHGWQVSSCPVRWCL